MEPPENARRWQERIDRCFPHGCIISSATNPQGYTYPVPRPEVIRMQGLDPVVFLDFPLWDRNFSGVITGWEEVRTSPCRVVKVTMDMGGGGHAKDEVMHWSGNVSAAQANALSHDRRVSLQGSADGRIFRRLDEDE